MRTRVLLATACFVAAAVGACGGSDNGLFSGAPCAQGPSIACTCAGGLSGTQACLADQSGYGVCVCADGGASGTGGDASTEAGKDAAQDGSGGKDAQGAGGSGGSSGAGGSAGKGGSSGAGGSGGSTGEAIATLGDPCSKSGELACAGHAQKLMLLCDGSKWVSNGVCPLQQICDTRPGLTAGSCQDPVPQCLGHQPGDGVCEGANRIVCGRICSRAPRSCARRRSCVSSAAATSAACARPDSTSAMARISRSAQPITSCGSSRQRAQARRSATRPWPSAIPQPALPTSITAMETCSRSATTGSRGSRTCRLA